MSYLRHKRKNLDRLINLEGIRHVECIGARPEGGPPYTDSGRITYSDGYVLEVSFECAAAVQMAFKSQTVPASTDSLKEQS